MDRLTDIIEKLNKKDYLEKINRNNKNNSSKLIKKEKDEHEISVLERIKILNEIGGTYDKRRPKKI